MVNSGNSTITTGREFRQWSALPAWKAKKIPPSRGGISGVVGGIKGQGER